MGKAAPTARAAISKAKRPVGRPRGRPAGVSKRPVGRPRGHPVGVLKRPVGRPRGRPPGAAASGAAVAMKRPRVGRDSVAAPKNVLLQRGHCDKAAVLKATEMTKEEWLEHQVGQDERFPPPPYMNGDKPVHTAYKDETYSVITCWTVKTKILYRPHAKRPGSKSHLRYEEYSVARTVGEALKLGSYPEDWCWDYERGFIKVVGGIVNDEPVDMEKAEESAITDVDRVIHTWFKREMAKRIGVTVAELSGSVPFGESLRMRCMRLLAQKEAREALEAADRAGRAVTDEDVLLVLKRWPFNRNLTRVNVMPKGHNFVFSDTLGLLRDRQGDTHLTAPTRRYPQVAELIARWLTDRLPAEAKGFSFTSMNLNCNYAARMHRDKGNFGPSFIKAFGSYSGGELNCWPEDPGGISLQELPKARRVTFEIDRNLVLFNGNCAHSVEDFTGTRYSVVYFTLGRYDAAPAEERRKLAQLGFPFPGAKLDRYALMRPPRGYGGGSGSDKDNGKSAAAVTPSRGRKQERAALRSWPLESLKLRATRQGKKRLEPENARSFYNTENRRRRLYGEEVDQEQEDGGS